MSKFLDQISNKILEENKEYIIDSILLLAKIRFKIQSFHQKKLKILKFTQK